MRSTDVEDLSNGDRVFYKRNENAKWQGPGIVIGKDGKQVLVRHGGIYIRVHTCRLQHDSSSSIVPEKPSSTNVQVEMKPLNSRNHTVMDGSDEESSPAISDLDRNREVISVIDETDDATPELQQQQPIEDGSLFSMNSNGKLKNGDVIEYFSGNGQKFVATIIS